MTSHPLPSVDGLTSHTLKNLRERWWDDEFTEFLAETLEPRPGKRILHVGCGEGLAEVAIGRMHISQIRLVGVDIAPDKVAVAKKTTAAHNQRVGFAGGTATALPFRDGAFDSTYCVAMLQHVDDVSRAVGELARVTAPNGRILVVEPDHGTRYLHSSAASGASAFEASRRFFAAVDAVRGIEDGRALGPSIPSHLAMHGVEALEVRLFPVSHSLLGAPSADAWTLRRQAVERVMARAAGDGTREAGRVFLDALAAYQAEATAQGAAFVEIQNTLLFATVGQRQE